VVRRLLGVFIEVSCPPGRRRAIWRDKFSENSLFGRGCLDRLQCGDVLKVTERRSLGVRFWFAACPWSATRLVAANKP
jgi:hypothetical protein